MGRMIAAVRGKTEFGNAMNAPTEEVFLLAGTLSQLPFYIADAKKRGKKLYVHMDMIEGIGGDGAAVEFLAKLGAYGMISTRGNLIKCAKNVHLHTVQRFFLVDAKSIKTATDTVMQTKPDYAELMPGTVCKCFDGFVRLGISVIAGGLVETAEEIENAFAHGAVAVSTSKEALWK